MTTAILHLSDIHIKGESDPILSRAMNIAACLFRSLPDASRLLIIVTGDIAFSGKPEQYALANNFFREIEKYVLAEKDLPINFVFTPGNHDCDFDLNTGVRRMVIESITQQGAKAIDESVTETCCSVQQPFHDFLKQFESTDSVNAGDKLWQTIEIECENSLIHIDCINVAWMSHVKETLGSLEFPYEKYLKKPVKADLRIAILHHPFNWLSQRTYHGFRKALRTHENIIFSGHEHVSNIGENTDSLSGNSAYVEGCVLQGEKDLSDSGFNVLDIDLNEGTWRASRYAWTGNIYETTEDGTWQDFRIIPQKISNPFQVHKTFSAQISDPGANFKRLSGHNIALSDLFVFPDLISNAKTRQPRQILSSQVLTEPSRLECGILLEADESSGATSLLYQLFERYHDRGIVPLLLKGEKLRGSSSRDIENWIKSAFEIQYGKNAFEKYSQLGKKQKLALIDDFGDSKVRADDHIAKVITGIKKRFGYSILVVSDRFEAHDVITNVPDSEAGSFQHYKILPFGYVLRAKLVKKWFSITDGDGSIDESTILERCDTAEKLMETAMVRNIVPSLPLYLLTLLQSIDAGLSGQFQESALGNYYFFLLQEGMKAAGIQPSKWDGLNDYCSDLAWHFHKRNASELSKQDLLEFNTRFSQERFSVDLDSQLGDLIASRILVKSSTYFRFRYRYIFYLLKGRYLARELSTPEIKSYVDHCCKHIYVRDNANTILFMAHQQAGQPYVTERIVETLNNLFKEKAPLAFSSNDTKGVEQLVKQLPILEYSGEAPEKHREKVNNLKDEIDDGKDGLTDHEEVGEALSVHAQVIMVLKTVEILGQLLKNQFSTLKREKRVEILVHLFNGPLRALRGYFDFIEKDPDDIVSEIDAILRERVKITDGEKRQKIAKEFAAIIVHLTAFGFIHKAASSVSAESLIEDIRSVANKTDTPAFRLIELAACLETTKKIPQEKIDTLISQTKDNQVSSRLLQTMVLRHLYMFRTTEMEKQWLASKGIVELRTQQVIEMQTKKIKAVKS